MKKPNCLAWALAFTLSLPAFAAGSSAPVSVAEFQPERLGGFSCRTEEDPSGLRVTLRLQNDSTAQLTVYERFAQVASARIPATVTVLASGDWTFSSEGYGLVVSSKSRVHQLVNGDKIRLFPAEFLGLLQSGRSISGSVVCVALARTPAELPEQAKR
jgi:hypothetical protein